jgi:hypothetical protein
MATKVKPGASKLTDAYLATLPPFSKKLCTELRAVARKAAPKLQEDFKWGRPCLTGHSIVCGYGAFKEHVSFDFWLGPQMSDKHGIFNMGRGGQLHGVKFVEGDKIPKTKLAAYIREAVQLDREHAARPPEKRGRPTIRFEMPDNLAKALKMKKHAKARAFYDTLPPSAQREFCDWIATAKREDTVARRLATTLEQLGRGERRHDKYRC